jgi:hypothetical protein
VFGTTGIGALRLSSDKDILADSRVLDDQRAVNRGALGFFIHGLQIDAVCRFGWLPVLSQASQSDIAAGLGQRTNIGYFNPNPFSVTATFNAHKSADGASIGAVTVTIPAFSHAQFPIFSLINTVAAADQVQTDFYVTYSVSGGTLFVYVAVGDSFTGDSYYTAGICPGPA